MIGIECIVTGRWRENCYVVHSPSGNAVIIDPGADAELICRAVDARGLRVESILLTHGHFDHIGAVHELCRRFDVRCSLHRDDHRLARRANLYRRLFDAEDPIIVPDVDPLPDPTEPAFVAPGFVVEMIHTPGHTAGGVCFRVGRDLFSGDTFHRGRLGRVDLPGGDREQLLRSVARLRCLPPETSVHPGHGGPTTIGAELTTSLVVAGDAHPES